MKSELEERLENTIKEFERILKEEVDRIDLEKTRLMALLRETKGLNKFLSDLNHQDKMLTQLYEQISRVKLHWQDQLKQDYDTNKPYNFFSKLAGREERERYGKLNAMNRESAKRIAEDWRHLRKWEGDSPDRFILDAESLEKGFME